MKDQTDLKHDAKPESSSKQKKPYAKPSFRCEQVFETMAVACGKTGNVSQQCSGPQAKLS